MVTANKIISDIRNLATSGSNPIDFRIEDSQILYWINEIRSKLISQAVQKRQDISDTWLQTISCMELIEVDKSECCEIKSNCTILRTKYTIADTVETSADNSIIRVETLNGTIISKSTPFEINYNSGNKYTSGKAKWYLKNNYMYIVNNAFLKYINIIGLFENPAELAQYKDCSGNTCFNKNGDYPCSFKMASDITDIVFKTKILPFIQMIPDNSNNGNNNLNKESTTIQ